MPTNTYHGFIPMHRHPSSQILRIPLPLANISSYNLTFADLVKPSPNSWNNGRILFRPISTITTRFRHIGALPQKAFRSPTRINCYFVRTNFPSIISNSKALITFITPGWFIFVQTRICGRPLSSVTRIWLIPVTNGSRQTSLRAVST